MRRTPRRQPRPPHVDRQHGAHPDADVQRDGGCHVVGVDVEDGADPTAAEVVGERLAQQELGQAAPAGVGVHGHRGDVAAALVLGTLNMNTHAKDAGDVLRVIADSMVYPTSNDYWIGGEPWILLGPEHAEILHREGLSKREVQRRLWEACKMPAARLAAKELERTRNARNAELGYIELDTLLPISPRPEDIGIVVAGAPGTHSVYIPSFGDTRSVTREVVV